VLTHIAGGSFNKESGRRFGISPRHIEMHRARIMNKIGTRNAADLVRVISEPVGRTIAVPRRYLIW
jgi:two-component system, LuxR family, response regulator FixJ